MAKTDKSAATETHIANMAVVPVGEVWADWSKNPRGRGVLPSKDDPTSFDFLRENILSTGGLLQPPLAVREDGPNGEKYRVIAGYRRFEVVSTLATIPEHAAKFSHIPLTIRDGVAVDLGSTEDPTAEEASPTFKRHEVGGRLGELLLAASENSARQDVSVWDRAAMATTFESEGLTTKEACAILGERGTSLSANQVRIYQKLGSLGVKLRKRLEKLGGAGYKLGTEIITAEYNQQAFPKIKWDVEKQTAHVDAYLEKIAEEAKEKEAGAGKKKAKAPRYVVKAPDLDARYRDIVEVASQDVIVTIDFLLGKATRADVVAATDEAFASALSGEGPDGPANSGAGPERKDALPSLSPTKKPPTPKRGGFFLALLTTLALDELPSEPCAPNERDGGANLACQARQHVPAPENSAPRFDSGRRRFRDFARRSRARFLQFQPVFVALQVVTLRFFVVGRGT